MLTTRIGRSDYERSGEPMPEAVEPVPPVAPGTHVLFHGLSGSRRALVRKVHPDGSIDVSTYDRHNNRLEVIEHVPHNPSYVLGWAPIDEPPAEVNGREVKAGMRCLYIEDEGAVGPHRRLRGRPAVLTSVRDADKGEVLLIVLNADGAIDDGVCTGEPGDHGSVRACRYGPRDRGWLFEGDPIPPDGVRADLARRDKSSRSGQPLASSDEWKITIHAPGGSLLLNKRGITTGDDSATPAARLSTAELQELLQWLNVDGQLRVGRRNAGGITKPIIARTPGPRKVGAGV